MVESFTMQEAETAGAAPAPRIHARAKQSLRTLTLAEICKSDRGH